MTTATQDNRLLDYLSLFTSFGTVVCCALPSLLVVVGLGATVASVLGAMPWLITLSQHKIWVFAVSGGLIAGNFLYVYALAPRLKASGEVQVCAVDAPSACDTASRVSRTLLWISAGIYLIGFFVAYLLLPIVLLLENIWS
ncbi:MAG: hypothetical protein HY701_11765 [Gemmatimonadetes bacterium]|nr:hypothetical protein [Gemmatimonadota bacterium]